MKTVKTGRVENLCRCGAESRPYFGRKRPCRAVAEVYIDDEPLCRTHAKKIFARGLPPLETGGLRCEVTTRETRSQCNNHAKRFVNGKKLCDVHAGKVVFENAFPELSHVTQAGQLQKALLDAEEGNVDLLRELYPKLAQYIWPRGDKR